MSKFKTVEGLQDELGTQGETTRVPAVVLHAGLHCVPEQTRSMPPEEFNSLVDSFQAVVAGIAGQSDQSKNLDIDYQLLGTQARVSIFDQTGEPDESALVVSGLKRAIILRNKWMTATAAPAAPVGIGLHAGPLFRKVRIDGAIRGEGIAAEESAAVWAASRHGTVSNIAVSSKVKSSIDKVVIHHSQLRQRLRFSALATPKDTGLSEFELLSYHRIGIHSSTDEIREIELLFDQDNANIWAYGMLIDHFAYDSGEWDKATKLAMAAHQACPQNEKVLYDLARCHQTNGDPAKAEQFALEALAINDSFDLAHELLATVAAERDDLEMQIRHLRQAVSLSPVAAVNNFNLGLALLSDRNHDEGTAFVLKSLELFPQYSTWPIFQESLHAISKLGLLPDALQQLI